MAVQRTPEQEAVVKNRGGSLLVSAAAGSGKTRVLVERLLDRILAVALLGEHRAGDAVKPALTGSHALNKVGLQHWFHSSIVPVHLLDALEVRKVGLEKKYV